MLMALALTRANRYNRAIISDGVKEENSIHQDKALLSFSSKGCQIVKSSLEKRKSFKSLVSFSPSNDQCWGNRLWKHISLIREAIRQTTGLNISQQILAKNPTFTSQCLCQLMRKFGILCFYNKKCYEIQTRNNEIFVKIS